MKIIRLTILRHEVGYFEEILDAECEKGDSDMTKLIKYPKSYHAPWSAGLQNDDKRISTTKFFENREVVVSLKLDGENSNMYRDHFHARSLDGRHHPSRDWVKSFWGTIRHDIPDGLRICGENMFARHSIVYDDLESYFYGFSVWEGKTCLSWQQSLEWFALLGIVPVPVVYRGIYDEKLIKNLPFDPNKVEGFVIRVADEIPMDFFPHLLMKVVRKGHVQTEAVHWATAQVIPNKLREK
jgi:hypothetical protein